MPEKNPNRRLAVILGVPFDNLTMAETVDRIEGFIVSGEPHYVATANVNFLAKALLDPEFMEVVRLADIITADGMPIVWASRLLGAPLKERVTGADLVPALVELASRRGYSVYFLGGREGVAERAVANLRKRYPGLNATAYCPEFSEILDMAHPKIIAEVKSAKPDMLFVSLGAGKAEKWIRMQLRQLKTPVCIGVGATVDFLAGEVVRAPAWMRESGLEWLFRLLQEPRRLFGRYLADFLHVTGPLLAQWSRYRVRRTLAGRAASPPQPLPEWNGLSVRGRLDVTNCGELADKGRTLLERDGTLTIDLSEATFIDSAGLGALVGLEKLARDRDACLCLAAPSPAAYSILGQVRLTEFFTIKDSLEAARTFAATRKLHASGIEHLRIGREIEVGLKDRLDASTAETVMKGLIGLLDENPDTQGMNLDLRRVGFIDSSGLSWLILLHKKAQRLDKPLRIVGTSPQVAHIFALTRVDRYFSYTP